MDKKQCNSCGKPKCSCKNKDFTKAVVEIDNPKQITLMRRVVIPASMGDDTAVPPVVGKYHNVLLYYEANQKSYLYSSDGIPTQLVNGLTNYEEAINLPQINGVTLLGDKSAADLELADAPMVITVANGNTSWSGADTAEDVYDFFLNKGKVNIVFSGDENYSYEVASAAYIPGEEKMMCTLAVASINGGGTAEFDGNALFGIMTLYTAHKAIDVSQIELQPKLYIADFTGLDLNYNELSGLPATTYSIGMVKSGDGLEVASDGTLSISDIEQYAHFFDTVADMKAATNLKAGDYARTGGFHAVNDGGGALYKITDTGTANEMDIIAIGSALYAQAIYPTVINPEMFGAYGDDTHDDSATLQYAFDLHKPIRLTKTYKTTTTINLCDWNYINVNAEGSIINYTGTGSAFFIYHIYGGDVRFGRIFSENGSCIKLASTDGVNDRVIYLNVFFTSLKCSDKCIEIINGGIGYVAEVRFYGGQIGTSQYGVHVTNDVTASNAGSNGLYFYNIGFEGSATNYYFNAPTYTLNGISMINNRYVENTSNTMFKFVGKMARIYMQSWGPMKETRIDTTDLTSITNSKITCPIMNSAGSTVFAQGIVWDKLGNKLYVHESKSQPAATLSSDVTGGTVKLELINGLAFIRLSSITSNKHSYDIVDSTNPLPNTFKPKANMVSSCVTTDGSTATFWVRANGSIAFSGDAADHGKAFTGELIYYPLADNT